MHQACEKINWENRCIRIERKPRFHGFKLSVFPNSTIQCVVPLKWTEKQISELIYKHSDWLSERLNKTLLKLNKVQSFSFTNREHFLLLGEPYSLKFLPSNNSKIQFQIESRDLICKIPKSNWTEGFENFPHPKIQKYLIQFYKMKAHQVLPPIFWKVVERMGYGPNKLILRNQKTLWGSCSRHNSSIQINMKLIAAPLSVIDYVMVHEISHLKFPNHGKNFWSEVEKHCEHFKQSQNWLKQEHQKFNFLDEFNALTMTKLEFKKS